MNDPTPLVQKLADSLLDLVNTGGGSLDAAEAIVDCILHPLHLIDVRPREDAEQTERLSHREAGLLRLRERLDELRVQVPLSEYHTGTVLAAKAELGTSLAALRSHASVEPQEAREPASLTIAEQARCPSIHDTSDFDAGFCAAWHHLVPVTVDEAKLADARRAYRAVRPVDVARGARFRTVEAGQGRAVHFRGPGGGRTLCGRKPTRLTDQDSPLCGHCRRILQSRVFVRLDP